MNHLPIRLIGPGERGDLTGMTQRIPEGAEKKAEDEKAKSRVRPKVSGLRSPGSWGLGKTEGVIAAGAWAARAEVANLLEDGVEIETLLYLIRKGCEGNHKLSFDGTLEDLESEDSVVEKAPSSRTTPSPPPNKASTREVLGDMSEEDWNVALAKQKSILESLSGGERPPWAKRLPDQLRLVACFLWSP